jgi:hypothetical protein
MVGGNFPEPETEQARRTDVASRHVTEEYFLATPHNSEMSSLFLRAAVWLREKALSGLRKVVLKVLASGPVPKHVAFVMDGNRRYARSRHLAIQQGHSDGFLALQRVRQKIQFHGCLPNL